MHIVLLLLNLTGISRNFCSSLSAKIYVATMKISEETGQPCQILLFNYISFNKHQLFLQIPFESTYKVLTNFIYSGCLLKI